ncbi:MAG: beta-ketoacyl synthase N-terminal-like domain-containing protein [Verrucomicrobiales bacterium]
MFDLSEHQFLHLIAIQECSAVPLRQRLFESLLVFQNYEVGEERESLGAAAIGEFTAPIRTNLPLTLVADPRDAFRAKAIYQADRFAESDARAMLGAWLEALRFIAANPSATAADLLAALRVPAASASAASEAPASARPYAAPRTATERQIAAIWQAAFGIERLSADDNFFDLGVHSLLMVHVHAKLRKALRRDLPLVTAFRYPTIAGLARHLDGDAEALVAADAPEPNAAAGGGIAIVGMVGRFPGAESIDELWENLCAGREAIATFTTEELREAGIDPAQGASYVPRRGVLTKPEFFDAAFFGITPREAEAMDPQQRIFLEACWEALEIHAATRPRPARATSAFTPG